MRVFRIPKDLRKCLKIMVSPVRIRVPPLLYFLQIERNDKNARTPYRVSDTALTPPSRAAEYRRRQQDDPSGGRVPFPRLRLRTEHFVGEERWGLYIGGQGGEQL
jgi:hypothetical protein